MVHTHENRLSVPCLHRVHAGPPVGVQRIYAQLGLSIERGSLLELLTQLHHRAGQAGCRPRSVYVTFDDGWADVKLIADDLRCLDRLQPVLFLTSRQLFGDRSALPLPRLYAACCKLNMRLQEFEASHGVTRAYLKSVPEAIQHDLLDEAGVPAITSAPETLDPTQVKDLMSEGWLIGSHGHDHHDLRFDDPNHLHRELASAAQAVQSIGGHPWLAWPEGRCTSKTCAIAQSAGFTLQFGLHCESGNIQFVNLVHRELWKTR